MAVGIARYLRKVVTGDDTPLATATSRFCGFPNGVSVLPTVTAKARIRRSGLGSDRRRDATPTRIGTPTSTSASLIRSPETIPIPTKRTNGRSDGLRGHSTSHRARCSNAPASPKAPTKRNRARRTISVGAEAATELSAWDAERTPATMVASAPATNSDQIGGPRPTICRTITAPKTIARRSAAIGFVRGPLRPVASARAT
jgi:hypothetical protein